jgi:hypothetical protein
MHDTVANNIPEEREMNGNAHSGGKEEEEKAAMTKEQKPSVLGKMWKKLDLDLGTVLTMMK